MLIFPRKYQYSGQLSRPDTVFRFFQPNIQKNQIFAKSMIFDKINFVGVRNSISGPIAQNLTKPSFLGVLGSIFLHFALLHSISLFSRQNRFWRAKSFFCEKVRIFAFWGDFLDHCGPIAQTTTKPVVSLVFWTPFSSFFHFGSGICVFSRQKRLFRKKMILRAQNGFGAKKVKLSRNVRNGGKWSPKHLKKDRFRKVLRDGAGNGIPGTKKLIFWKNHTFSKKSAFSRFVENFVKKSESRFGSEKWSRILIFLRKHQHSLYSFGYPQSRFFKITLEC